MRYPASEKAEIIQLVEQFRTLPGQAGLRQTGIPRATFYRWHDDTVRQRT